MCHQAADSGDGMVAEILPPIPEDPSRLAVELRSGRAPLDGRIPQNLLTTLVRQAKRSRFLPPLFIMFTTAFQRQFDGGKKCWPRCRYRTMILMMGSKRTEPNHKQKQKNQGNDKKTLGRGQLQQIAGMPMLIINNFYIFATSLGGFASQLKGELQWQGYLLCQPAKGHDNNP
uniref:HDC06456 n=1 Tax=Drosophila melanogaster TaxID=7227 RepID=Q6IGF4_DROME|nr:TPA_inf: HDC06456 [Drosophila melanogaster]